MSQRWFSTVICFCFVCCGALNIGDGDVAARDRESAEQLVAEALHREIYGLHADRDRLLAEAADADPDYAPARWHRGFVRVEGAWTHVYDAPRFLGTGTSLDAYRNRRETTNDTIEAQLELANWCRDRRLPDQERAHLTRVLDLDANQADARARLGYQLVAGQWLENAELERQAERRAWRQVSLDQWRDLMLDLRQQLSDTNPDNRNRAAAQVRSITLPAAIPAFEEILSSHSQYAARLVVESLAQMPEEEAVVSLVRHAILSPWIEIRDEAALRLKSRPHESFVPLLLAEMYTPVESQTAIAPAGGRLVYQHAFARESQDQREVLVLNSIYRRRAIPGGDRQDSLSRAWSDIFMTATRLQQSAEQQNAWTRLANERIARVLNLATQQNLAATPQAWWQWWNQQNDVVLQGNKPLQAQQLARQMVVQDRTPPQFGSVGGQGAVSPQQRRSECFAAGTLVWTASGCMPIETIRIGDTVLSQNVETGELAYKPVLRTTIRPMERLVKIRVGNDTLQTSGGHLFWVSGQGWSKARELTSGRSLHAVQGAIPVLAIEEGVEAQTYNLLVADFGTYVVGVSKILSHDVSDRRPTRTIVPGLAAY